MIEPGAASKNSQRGALLLAVCTFGLLWFGCADENPAREASASCTLDSECVDPLICAFEKCHQACRASRDCPDGRRCVRGTEQPYSVCQLEEEVRCSRNSDCVGEQVCAADLQCRDACITDRDCPSEQTCAAGVCADPPELVGGVVVAATEPGLGTPCVLATDCPTDLVCLDTRVCGPECLTDKDCWKTWSCQPQGAQGFGRCVPDGYTPPGGDAGDAGPGSSSGALPDAGPLLPNPVMFQADTLAVGESHACRVQDPTTVRCWGSNADGELGLGDTRARGTRTGSMGAGLPNVSLGLGAQLRARQVTAGGGFTCLLSDDGRVKCWGRNDLGQLGLGDTESRGGTQGSMGDALPFVDLGTGRRARVISAGDSHVCALLDDLQVKCWGANPSGGLGLGDTRPRGARPGEMGDALPAVVLEDHVTNLSAGQDSTCAVLANGGLRCWGENARSDLGIPAQPRVMQPTAVDVGVGVVGVSARMYGYCALSGDKRLKCWGTSKSGALGLGDLLVRGANASEMGAALPFVDLGGANPVATVVGFVGSRESVCALSTDAQIRCWGENTRQQLGVTGASIGDGPGEMGAALKALTVVPKSETGPFVAALASSVRSDTFCALLDDGSVKCWGADDSTGNGGILGFADDKTRSGSGTANGTLPPIDLRPYALP